MGVRDTPTQPQDGAYTLPTQTRATTTRSFQLVTGGCLDLCGVGVRKGRELEGSEETGEVAKRDGLGGRTPNLSQVSAPKARPGLMEAMSCFDRNSDQQRSLRWLETVCHVRDSGFYRSENGTSGVEDSLRRSVPLRSQSCKYNRVGVLILSGFPGS